MNEIIKCRPNWIDFSKVIMIYVVVLGHYTYAIDLEFRPSGVWSLMHFITLFHMPFFFIVSGFLYKKITVKETVKKGWVQLMRPYFLMCIISCVIMIFVDLISLDFSLAKCASLVVGVFTGNDAPHGSPNWSSALWFCYSLFIIKYFVSLLQNCAKSILIMRVGYVILLAMCICVLYCGNIFPFRIDSSLIGIFFFVMGYFFRDWLNRISNMSSLLRCYIMIVMILFLYLSAKYNLDYDQRQGLSINACAFGPYPFLFLISGLSGSLFVLVLSTFIKTSNKFLKNIILQLSNGTIVILGFHWIIYRLIFAWWLSSYSLFCAFLVALLDLIICYFIILMCGKYFPALLGNRTLNR